MITFFKSETFKLAFKRVLAVLLWVVLILFAKLLLNKWLLGIAFTIGMVDIFRRRKIGKSLDRLSASLRRVAYTMDMLGCVTLFDWTWFVWKKKNGAKFGAEGITVSHVLKKNYDDGTLTQRGIMLYNFIKFWDADHFDDMYYSNVEFDFEKKHFNNPE